MRIPITLSERSASLAKAYAANPHVEDAVEYLIEAYGNLVGDIRKLRSRLDQLDNESAEVDAVVGRLREIAKLIEEL